MTASRSGGLVIRLAVLSPEDGLGRDVAEVHVLLAYVKVQGHHVHEVLVHQVVLVSVHGHVADVVLVGEYQPRWDVVLALARVLVVLPLVVGLVALAVEASGGIGTVLRTGAGLLQALVHVSTGFAIGQESRGVRIT